MSNQNRVPPKGLCAINQHKTAAKKQSPRPLCLLPPSGPATNCNRVTRRPFHAGIEEMQMLSFFIRNKKKNAQSSRGYCRPSPLCKAFENALTLNIHTTKIIVSKINGQVSAHSNRTGNAKKGLWQQIGGVCAAASLKERSPKA